MSTLATTAAITLSLAGLGWLNATDPKRRRAFGMKPLPGARPIRAIWTAVLLPGILMPVWSGGAGFVLWLGATSVLAWALIALPPGKLPVPRLAAPRLSLSAAALTRGWSRLRATVAATPPFRRAAPAETATLATRVARLEAELADLRDALRADRFSSEAAELPEETVVELATGRRR